MQPRPGATQTKGERGRARREVTGRRAETPENVSPEPAVLEGQRGNPEMQKTPKLVSHAHQSQLQAGYLCTCLPWPIPDLRKGGAEQVIRLCLAM